MSENLQTWIEQERLAHNLTIRELAKRSGLSSGTITDVLSGRTRPGVKFCNNIAGVFDVPPELVFRKAGLLPSAPEETERLTEAHYLFSRLTTAEQEQFLAQMRAVLEMKRDARQPEASP